MVAACLEGAWRALGVVCWSLTRLWRIRGGLYPLPLVDAASVQGVSAFTTRLRGRRTCGTKLGRLRGQAHADRIFLMVSQVLTRAIRRSGVLQRGHIVSMPNVLLSNSLHEM